MRNALAVRTKFLLSNMRLKSDEIGGLKLLIVRLIGEPKKSHSEEIAHISMELVLNVLAGLTLNP